MSTQKVQGHLRVRVVAAFASSLILLGLANSSTSQEKKSEQDKPGVWDKHPVNQWVRQSPRAGQPAPPFGWEGSGAYDPGSHTWIHFGGHDGIPQGFHLFTFRLDTGKWEQRFPNTSPPGVCCVDAAATFDVANRRFVRFPGASLGHGYQWSRGVYLKRSHVWLFDPDANTWTNMRPAPYRPFLAREGLGNMNASATYDPNHELALSFGGQGNSGGTNNLFAYDAYANRLYRLPGGNPPSPRDGSGLTYDVNNDCLVMFGSQYANDEQTWIYRHATGKWECRTPSIRTPSAKSFSAPTSTIPPHGLRLRERRLPVRDLGHQYQPARDLGAGRDQTEVDEVESQDRGQPEHEPFAQPRLRPRAQPLYPGNLFQGG